MNKLVTAAQMKSYDNYTIEKIGVPSMVLMERAALAIFDVLTGKTNNSGSKKPTTKEYNLSKVLCVASAGNNGGDGFALARLLKLHGVDVEVLFIGDKDKFSPETSKQYEICQNYDVKVYENDLNVLSDGEYSTIVDAIFGIGLGREVEGKYKEAINLINQLSDSPSSSKPIFIVSADIPSGLSADKGKVLGVAVKADTTVTFAFNKIGMTINKGPEYAGNVIVADIGIVAPNDF